MAALLTTAMPITILRNIVPLLLLLSLSNHVLSERIYHYRDNNGGVVFTDQNQDQVPSDYKLLSIRKGWDYKPQALTKARRDQYDSDIRYAAQSYQVDAALIKAVIHAESHFNRHAISKAGAQGLMQLMPQTANYLRVHNPFNARQNILGGARFLAYLKGKFTSLEHVLAAYNAGEGNVRRHGGIPPFPETQHYVGKVKELMLTYTSHFAKPSNAKIALR